MGLLFTTTALHLAERQIGMVQTWMVHTLPKLIFYAAKGLV